MKYKIACAVLSLVMLSLMCSCSDDNKANVIGNGENDAANVKTEIVTQIVTNTVGKTEVATKIVEEVQKITENKSEVPVDVFASPAEMEKKARNYKSLRGIYLSSGFSETTDYYTNYEYDKLTMILDDKFVPIPEFDDSLFFIQGGLYAFGYYTFYVQDGVYSPQINVYTYHDKDVEKLSKKSAFKTKNGVEVFVDKDNNYYFEVFGYWAKVMNLKDNNSAKSFIEKIKFTKLEIK